MEIDLAEARATFETNLFAVINMCQTFLPLLKKAQGTIVQIGSVADKFMQHILSQRMKLRLSGSSSMCLGQCTVPQRPRCIRSVILLE